MDYKEILEEQKSELRQELSWWPNFLYHFTDVHNAANILHSGWIYSREKAKVQDVMKNDNASQAVIEATSDESKCYGRLYFRPLTPTQYHNEGYKPVEVRKSELNASCPVPIFFCFSAAVTLNYINQP
ncbi:MAG: DarT ssDNA thymidine ADP-ribosyltransferase family protein [Lachnospiraceae bacterium]